MPQKKASNPVNIESTVHEEKRTNIPTQELRGFVKDDEDSPKKMLYHRDTSLDPQLVWRGKDEQDSKDLEVPTVPIYIQEKIHPKYIIEDLREQSKKGQTESQIQLFSDFNGLKFEELVEFYQHEQHWSNRMILGDSLLVMTSLAEKEGLKGKVQMIYLDPPYGISFNSNWQVSTRKRDVKDGKAQDATRQPEQVKAFRDTWKDGINSYLAYLRDRLVVARELLSETGSVFMQIGDENVHLVRCLMDEVFGNENFVSQLYYKKTTGAGSPGELLAPPAVGDYISWYAKDKSRLKYRKLFSEKGFGGEGTSAYKKVELSNNTRLSISQWEKQNNTEFDFDNIPEGIKVFALDNLTSQSGGEAARFPIIFKGKEYRISKGSWKTNTDGIHNETAEKPTT